jgi:hypothetical protein
VAAATTNATTPHRTVARFIPWHKERKRDKKFWFFITFLFLFLLFSTTMRLSVGRVRAAVAVPSAGLVARQLTSQHMARCATSRSGLFRSSGSCATIVSRQWAGGCSARFSFSTLYATDFTKIAEDTLHDLQDLLDEAGLDEEQDVTYSVPLLYCYYYFVNK